MARRNLTAALQLAVLSSFVACGAVFAADSDPSLDPMWTDPAVADKKTAAAPAETQPDAPTGSAPLCSIDSLKQSALIKTGGWPGIGPFKGDGNEYVDAGQNRLKVESSKDKITSAELRLNNQNKNTAIFNLEMSADFLLESLGAKAARISDFNGQLEKSRAKLLQSSESTPLNLSAGSYLVYLHPEQDKSAADKYSFVIKVSSKDASSDLIKRHSSGATASVASASASTTTASASTTTRSTVADTSSENGWDTSKTTTKTIPPETAIAKTTSSRSSIPTPAGLGFGIETGVPKGTARVTTTQTKIATALPTTTSSSSSTSSSITSSTTSSTDDSTPATAPLTMKDTFRDVIAGWQKLKKVAVRQRDTSELSQVLSGRALVRQSDAIKWLQTNHKYYDMNPKGIVVDRFVDLGKGQKYAVYAQVKESSKYMDEPTGQVIKDSEDTYNVNYTIERSGDKWLISDSSIVGLPTKTSTKTR